MINFHSIADLLTLSARQHIPVYEIVLLRETEVTQRSRAELWSEMRRSWHVMEASLQRGLTQPRRSSSGLTGGDAQRLACYAGEKQPLLGPIALHTAADAVATAETNACMGRIVACPTAGSCGIVPAVLYNVSERLHKTEDDVIAALFTAAGFGMVVDENASIAGAEGGCQAECGTAAGMAAAAAVQLADGSPEQSAHACALAIKNLLGLVCDPVAGLVEIPCVKRNGFAAVHALLAADMALAGVKSVIPVDEVIDAMYQVGRALPRSLRETAEGGLAVTPTGKAAAERISGKNFCGA